MKFIFSILIALTVFYVWKTPVFAVVNPAEKPNNKVGIHIFDPSEIDSVAPLVNSNGGEWGYVTVPLRSDDCNREKWNEFMDKCRQYRLIPIIRLATRMTPSGWTKPTRYDAVDFANFLNDLRWPTKNRYVIVYNETNHATEWGGEVNPNEYAKYLNETIDVFKERNQDFFMLPAGLDAAAPNNATHMNWRRYLYLMSVSVPGVLSKVDGWTSHSYPNPAFSGPPTAKHDHSIVSYKHETEYVRQLTGRLLPTFITETGWSTEFLSNQIAASYLSTAFSNVWNDQNIITVTPFVLQAGEGQFSYFSFLFPNGEPKPQYESLKNLPKVKGEPYLPLPKPEIITILPVLGEATVSATPYPHPETSLRSKAQKTLDYLVHWIYSE